MHKRHSAPLTSVQSWYSFFFFLSCFVFCFVLFFFLNLECAEIRWNIEKISVFCLFRSDQSKLYGEIQRHAIVIVYNYVYWQMIDITIVSCKSADSNMTQKHSIVSSEDLESLKFPWRLFPVLLFRFNSYVVCLIVLFPKCKFQLHKFTALHSGWERSLKCLKWNMLFHSSF